jgi:hypothetical protein
MTAAPAAAASDVATGLSRVSPGIRSRTFMSSRQPHPFRLATRKRVYLAMMGGCLLLLILAWTVIYRYSDVR